MNIHFVDYSNQYYISSARNLELCLDALWIQFEAACFILLGRLFEGWTEGKSHHAEGPVGHELTESRCLC